MHDVKAMADGIVSTLKAFVTKAEAALSSRIDTLETQLKSLPVPKDGRDGVDGKDGADGKSADEDKILTHIADVINASVPAEVERAVAALPVPKDGKDGTDGKSVTLDEIKALIPEPIQGPKGEDGKSVTLDEIKALIPEAVPGKDGRDGVDGKSFTAAEAQELVEAAVTKAQLEFERRMQDTFVKAVQNIPKPADGKDGKDGLGFDDLTVEFDGQRSLSLKFIRGDQVKTFDFTIPALIDKGYYRSEETYVKGDGVTFGGSYWAAKMDAPASKPGEGTADEWTLIARKGRDGKHGEKGMDGKNGLPGRDAR